MSEQTDHVLASLIARRVAFEDCLSDPEMKAQLEARSKSGCCVAFATCPCCGYPTIYERAGYDICNICNWEDDGQDDPDFSPYPNYYLPDVVAGGPNSDYSLTEARKNFAAHHQMYRPSDKSAFDRENEDRELREELLAIFDSLLPRLSALSYIEALPDVESSFKRISEALHIRVNNYEKAILKARQDASGN